MVANQALQDGVIDCRNRTMQQMFLMISLGERAGSVLEMRWAPSEKTDDGVIPVRMRSEMRRLSEDSATARQGEVDKGSFLMQIGIRGTAITDVDNTDRELLCLIRQNGKITLEELSASTEKSRRTITRRIGRLKNICLRRVGADETGYWKILK
ncbi:hypothetical protein AGMMS49545_08610 [Betaproteobacteria bacterium]|nr:hypothetical protein AGMMS49545_08610 [Betaproteobacteria bacterium]GHU41362.1 hypothetical protein AGMMS50289_04390 [Betaproteobacteria bacterium]